jgi:alkylhydroperoxidase family enzyme
VSQAANARCLDAEPIETKEDDMTSTHRIPRAEITGIFGAMAKRFSKKKLGQVPESLGVMWHNRPVLTTYFGFSRKAQKWDACDLQLKSFAHMAAVSQVGCSACLDFGYLQAHNEKLDLDKAREVPRWRESGAFTPLERDVMEYAEAMTHTPPAVTDEMSERLLDQLGAPALVELTAFIAAANMASRANVALGIEGQGFSAACGLQPLATPAAEVASPA